MAWRTWSRSTSTRTPSRARTSTIDGETWQTWTDAGGDYALSRGRRRGRAAVESWLVVGTAPEATIRDFAAQLKGGKLRRRRVT